MSRARITLDRDFTVGEVPRRIFGSFVEHMGRCVYTGIYEPGHPTADDAGLPHVTSSTWSRSSGATVVRYPGRQLRLRVPLGGRRRPGEAGRGGSTAPGTRSRPTRSGCTSSSTGPRVADVEVMEADQPRHPGRRGGARARRVRQPPRRHRAVRPAAQERRTRSRSTSGCGAWATRWTARGRSAHKTADEYGRLAQEAAKAMRLVDPTDRAGRRAARSNSRHADVRRVGADGARARLRRGGLRLAARLLPGARRRPRELPGQRRRHGLLHRVGGRDRRRRPGARASTRSTSTSRSTSGTSGTQPARTPRTSRT